MSLERTTTPRLFIIRHGQTLWSETGQFTSHTELDLTAAGIKQVEATKTAFIGQGKLIDPDCVARIFVSPRKRATTTAHLLFGERLENAVFTEEITEWNYGDLEGLTKQQIRQKMRDSGWVKDREWDVRQDGCDGGETVDQVSDRLDNLITRIKDTQWAQSGGNVDVVIVAHGLILRCLATRWLGLPLQNSIPMELNPGAVGILSYKDNDIGSPALHVGIALPCIT